VSGRTGLHALRDVRIVATCAALVLALSAFGLHHVALSTDGLSCVDYTTATWTGDPGPAHVVSILTADTIIAAAARHGEPFSTECHGWLYLDEPGDYTLVAGADDALDVRIDGQRVIEQGGPHGLQYTSATMPLMPGAHQIDVRYGQFAGAYAFGLLLGRESQPPMPLPASRLSRIPRVRMEHRQQVWTPLLAPGLALAAIAALLVGWRRECTRAFRLASSRLRLFGRWVVGSTRRTIGILLAVSVGLRVVVALCSFPIVWPDSFAYYYGARAILTGDWFSHEVFRTPLYPGFMALFFASGMTPGHGVAVIVAQHLLGVAATLLVFDLGRRAVDEATGLLAALMWTASPLTFYYETSVASESLFVALVILAVWWAARTLHAPGTLAFVALGAVCGAATLTRPVGKGLVVALAAVLLLRARGERRVGVAVAMATTLVVLLPWAYVNTQTYGFAGVSRGEGLGLFMRAFDIERFPMPAQTSQTAVLRTQQRLAPAFPYLHYRVRDDLNYAQRLSAVQTDDAMAAYSLDAIRERPLAYAAGIAYDWVLLFVSPHRSVTTCSSVTGEHLCSDRSDGQPVGPFVNAPTNGRHELKAMLARYVNAVYPLLAFLLPVAIIGGLLQWRATSNPTKRTVLALLAATVLYFSVISVTFNTAEDRYRLPADAFVMILASAAVGRLLRQRARAHDDVRADHCDPEIAA
jgi:4-amino-4-deoxy-L-arabinose transferase-like glycosyltransferase